MSVYESSITNPKKQLEFYKDLSEQLQQENQNLKGTIETYDILLKSNVKGTKVIEELEKWLREQHEKVWDKVAEEMLIDTLFKLKQLQEEGK